MPNTSLDDYVAALSDDELAEIAADHEQLAATGSTGDTALRKHTEAFDALNGGNPLLVAMSMHYMAFAVFRRLARVELRRQGRI